MSQPITRPPPARRITSIAVALLLALAVLPGLGHAAPAPGVETVRSFYAALLDTMKNGPTLGQKGRYEELEPVVHKVFDVDYMTRMAVGPAVWAKLSQVKQQQVTAAFARYIAATYADRFDRYSGEELQVTDAQPYASDIIVRSRIVKSNGEPVSIDYLVRQNGDSWQISDVYLTGTISELATRRSEFSSILRSQGIDGLIATLNRKADMLGAAVARS